MTSTIARKYVTVGNLEHYTETFTTNVLNAALSTYAASFGASLSINGTSLSLVNSSGTTLNSVTIPVTTSLAWSDITSKPSTFTPSSHTHGSNDITGLDAAKITSGTIDLDRLPQGALDRLVKVADQAARFALTTATVQNGDTVQQLDTELMYRVVDDTKLNSEDGYVKYTADRASAVPWSGVTDKPQTFTPSSHNHAGTEVSLTGYSKPSTTSAVETTDTVNAAIGKLEKAIDGKQASGSYLTPSSSLDASKLTGTVPSGCYTNTTYSAAANDAITLSGTTFSHSTSAGYKHIPSGGSSGKLLTYGGSSGTASWSSSSVGSSSQPMYLNAGVPTACGFKVESVVSLPANPDSSTLYIIVS